MGIDGVLKEYRSTITRGVEVVQKHHYMDVEEN